MSYECRIEADSIGPSGCRLTTLVVTYPRFVHAELLTHRLLSRNSSSSRAIPTERLIEKVIDDPVVPAWWGRNQRGMQAFEELPVVDRESARKLWLQARDAAVTKARQLMLIGVHKQLVNRLIEPWMWITVIVSATDWSNFFALRCDPAAQPELQMIANMMREAILESVPIERGVGEWHLPFVVGGEGIERNDPRNRALSVARCARVSYLTHDGRHDPAADISLHDRLAESGHWSPFEHVAQALEKPDSSGNFDGWLQYRKTFPSEHRGRRRT